MRKYMLAGLALCMASGIIAQRPQGGGAGTGAPQGGGATSSSAAPQDARTASYNIPFNPESTVTSEHEVTIKGTKVP
jgi:hypothetical protein